MRTLVYGSRCRERQSRPYVSSKNETIIILVERRYYVDEDFLDLRRGEHAERHCIEYPFGAKDRHGQEKRSFETIVAMCSKSSFNTC